MDDRAYDVLCGVDRYLEKQGEHGAPFFGTGSAGRDFGVRHEQIFFVAKSCSYYCAESTYGFDMRISWISGLSPAFLHPDFEHAVRNSQK